MSANRFFVAQRLLKVHMIYVRITTFLICIKKAKKKEKYPLQIVLLQSEVLLY